MLVTSIVCFSCSFVRKVYFSGLLKVSPLLNKPWFLHFCSKNLLKTPWEKEKFVITSNFSFSHSVFYLFGELSAIFTKFKIVVCKLFQIGSVYNLSSWKGVKKLKPLTLKKFAGLQKLCLVSWG